jgi:hypothetical protein
MLGEPAALGQGLEANRPRAQLRLDAGVWRLLYQSV